jgi:3a0107s01c2: phosphate ABC transporter, ATP-binding protein
MIDAAGTHVIYEVKHLEKSFGKVEVLKDINIQIGNGEVLTIIGPSGSGKSTFLRCLNLLEKPTGGELWFDGRLIDGKTDVKMLRRDVGMVFQSFNLFPMFSAVENVMYAPVHINKLDKETGERRSYGAAFPRGHGGVGQTIIRGSFPADSSSVWLLPERLR